MLGVLVAISVIELAALGVAITLLRPSVAVPAEAIELRRATGRWPAFDALPCVLTWAVASPSASARLMAVAVGGLALGGVGVAVAAVGWLMELSPWLAVSVALLSVASTIVTPTLTLLTRRRLRAVGVIASNR